MVESPPVFPLLHNGPVHYFARLVSHQTIVLEQHDHYIKQTYRNRCRVLGPNGILTLSIPVKRVRGMKNKYRDIRVDYDSHWNRIHWKSMEAGYASSPFFALMADELEPFYHKEYTFLFDLNLDLLNKILELLQVRISLCFSEDFKEITRESDPRQLFHPKIDTIKRDPAFSPVAYHQVFSREPRFHENLSILDLLFNEGPGALTVLRSCLAES
jgi:hypothetical protein